MSAVLHRKYLKNAVGLRFTAETIFLWVVSCHQRTMHGTTVQCAVTSLLSAPAISNYSYCQVSELYIGLYVTVSNKWLHRISCVSSVMLVS